MKLIIAVIRPHHFEAVQKALEGEGVFVTCVSEVVGGGREPGCKLRYREREVVVRRPKFRVEIMVEEWAALEIADLIRASTVAGCPGNVSDAQIMVLQLAESAPVRSNDAVAMPARIKSTGVLCAN